MGEVYEAEDQELRSRVALKTVLANFAADDTALERLKREVLLGRRVSHPNVCRTHELYVTRTADGEATPLPDHGVSRRRDARPAPEA